MPPYPFFPTTGRNSAIKLSGALFERLGINKICTSSYHPCTNGGVERVNHTMALMLAMVGNELQNDWDLYLPHVESAYNNSASAATGLAPNEVHIGPLPRLPLTVFPLSQHRSTVRPQPGPARLH